MKPFIFLIIPILAFESYAQKKNIVQYIDTLVVENHYLQGNQKNDIGLLKSEMNILQPDQELINASVFWEINSRRKRSGKKTLNFSKELYQAGAAYIKRYSKTFFENAMEDQQRLNKPMKDIGKKLNYNKGIIRAFVYRVQVVNYDGRAFYHDSKCNDEGLNLFYGKFPNAENLELEEKNRKAVALYSHQNFASTFVKNKVIRYSNRYLKSKAYTEMACYIYIDPNTIHKNLIPEANCILILAGPRLGLVSQK